MAASHGTFNSASIPKSHLQTNDPKADHKIVSEFHGYRAKENMTSLAPGYLVPGSQNVITLASGQVAVRGGTALDGQAGSGSGGIVSAYDWKMYTGLEQHLRVDGVNGKLQFRYVANGADSWSSVAAFTASQIYWIDLVTGLSSTQTTINFAIFADITNTQEKLLYVNGDTSIYEWGGGVATYASATSTTITKQGTGSWKSLGFFDAGTRSITLYDSGGTARVFTYTGGESTTTLTGLTTDPTGFTFNVGGVAFQTVRTNANSASTGLPSTLANQLIASVNQQVFIASLTNNAIYASKVNSFTDFSFTSPTRLVGEGAKIVLGSAPVGLINQEETLYMTAGLNEWYQAKYILSADTTSEILKAVSLKTSPGQAAISQAGIFKAKNSLMFITNEPAIDDLGRVADNLVLPETVTITDSIRNDFFGYNLTNASGIYYRYFLFIAVPKQNLILVYNFTKEWWEAPITAAISRFSVIKGKLYGHSSLTNETYQLFYVEPKTSTVPYDDNSQPINAIAAFSYMNYGDRAHKKNFTELYLEGGITQNTNLSIAAKYDFGGFTSIKQFTVPGNNANFLVYTSTDGSIGKNPLGSNPLGSVTDSPTDTPKFRHIFTVAELDFYEWQPVFQTNAVDFYWELLAFGVDIKEAQSQNNEIKS